MSEMSEKPVKPLTKAETQQLGVALMNMMKYMALDDKALFLRFFKIHKMKLKELPPKKIGV